MAVACGTQVRREARRGALYHEQVAGLAPTFDIAPDGKRFLMIKEVEGAPPPSAGIVVVQHWVEELERLVPAN